VPHTLQGFKAELFKALAHPARIKILEHLRSGERTVSELQALLDLESSTVSQQLALLRSRSIVEGRKQGTSVYYRVPDRLIFELLDVARQIFANHVVGLQAMADEESGHTGPVVGQVGANTDQGVAANLGAAAEVRGAERA
jgi:DNA-binding transcriptional ArsR family regulator